MMRPSAVPTAARRVAVGSVRSGALAAQTVTAIDPAPTKGGR